MSEPSAPPSDSDAAAQLRFGELLAAAPDAILEIDSGGKIVLANPMAERMFGYSRAEFPGLSVDDLVPPHLRAAHAGHRATYAAKPSTRPMGVGLELRACRKDGSEFPVEISLSPIRAADGVHVMAIVRDVRRRSEAEQQLRELQAQFTEELEAKNRELEQRNAEVERSNRLKSEFLASMSHELRSPLHTIIGFAELLSEELEGSLNERQKRFVRNIQQDSQHLLAIINDLLDISKIEAGRMEFHTETFDLTAAAAEVLETIEPQATAKSLKLETGWPAGVMVEADRLRCKQILMNLLTNAVKFTPEGGRITVSMKHCGRRVAVTVRDNGIGIAAEDHEAIFDKFYQAGSTTKGVREGTGLGLAITKKLVEQQGGRIWVESELGHGSAFTFAVPSDSVAARNRRLVLILEDEPRAAELLVGYLEPEGFDTCCASSPAQALSIGAGLLPDAIIVDLTVPTSREWRMIRDLRNHPDTVNIPLVVVSVTDESDIAAAVGAQAHLTKPVSKRVLIDTLAKCIARGGAPHDVLVLDDEPMARQLVGDFLREAGYRPILAASGAAAIEAIQAKPPSAVVLDLLMPGMNGFEFLSALKENPAWASIPVMVLTGLELDSGHVQLLERTAVAILRKGHSWKQPLLAALQRAIANRVHQ